MSTPSKVPPGPPPRRGGLRSLPYYARFAMNPLGYVGQRFAKYGDIYYAPCDDTGLYVVRHPDHIREVLATRSACFSKTHSSFARLRLVLGNGLVTADGEDWKRHRRMIQPAFSRDRLRGYAEVMVDESERAVDRLASRSSADISEEMVELTMRIVSRTLFSHDVSSDTDHVASAMRTLNASLSRPDVLPRWMPSPARTRAQRSIAGLDDIVYRLIDQRMEAIGRGDADLPSDLLQMLATAVDTEGDGEGMPRQQVRDELVTLFLAGHETTSHALSWAWMLLSQNPGVRARLVAELDDVLGGRAPTFEDLDALPYTELVLKEAMRLYPPAFVLSRKSTADTEIGGYEVPAGSEVIVWTYYTHRDARWYPEPEAFRPERFEPGAYAKLPKMAYLPFGGGPRACIGANFSLIEARLILATLAQRLRFDLPAGHRVRHRTGVTLAPRGGLPMGISRRKGGPTGDAAFPARAI